MHKFINHNGITCHISKIDQPYKIWYHIWVKIERYGEDYIEEKLGVTDPILQQEIQDEYNRAAKSYHQRRPKPLEGHNLRLDGTDYPYYLANKTRSSVTVYMEKGLFTLGENRPTGHPWAIINKADKPAQIQGKLYDHRKRFGEVMHKKLHKIMGW